MDRSHYVFTQNERVEFGKLGTSIASLGVAGNWGGAATKLTLFVSNRIGGEQIAMCAVNKEEWLEASNKMPLGVILGEGVIVSISLRNAVNPNLTVSFREVRLGRRGG